MRKLYVVTYGDKDSGSRAVWSLYARSAADALNTVARESGHKRAELTVRGDI